MQMGTRLLAVALVSTSLAACVDDTLPRQAHLLTAADMRRGIGITGVTSWGQTPGGDSFVSYTSPDGTARLRSADYWFTDQGVWHITPDGRFCIAWQKVKDGKETCVREFLLGKTVYDVAPDGHVLSVITRQAPGNPEHLYSSLP